MPLTPSSARTLLRQRPAKRKQRTGAGVVLGCSVAASLGCALARAVERNGRLRAARLDERRHTSRAPSSGFHCSFYDIDLNLFFLIFIFIFSLITLIVVVDVDAARDEGVHPSETWRAFRALRAPSVAPMRACG